MISLPDDTWYKNAVIYAVDIKSFQDSNGDGIGDFPGLISRLGYLQELGITCLWLLPFYPTPDGDNGYDVTNYQAVDPRLGTLDDFIALVRKAGERGIRVIIELVMNHTSIAHPWFEASRRAADSRYRDYYIWRDRPPVLEPGHGSAFPGTEESSWTFDEIAGAYYYHLFYKFQPDLNTSNPEVVQEMLRLMDFWLSFGVSGFRLDAIGVMVEKRLSNPALREDPIEMLVKMRNEMRKRRPDGVLLGEADVPVERLISYFGTGGRLNMLLNFFLNQYLYLAFAQERAEPVKQALELLGPVPFEGQWMNFLRNLDELNIGKIPEELRERVYKAFGPDPEMRIYGRGIRRRLAPMMNGDVQRILMAQSLLFSLPGSPMIVYGDEIGMGDDLTLFERNSVRTSMQWSEESNGGFSTASPDRLYRPVISGGPYGYPRTNVQRQRLDPNSLWTRMQRLILARRRCPEVGLGNWEIVETGDPAVFAHRCDWKEGTVFMIHNLSRSPRQITIEAGGLSEQGVEPLVGRTECRQVGQRLTFQLTGYGYGWYRLGRASPVAPELRAADRAAGKERRDAPPLVDIAALEKEAEEQTDER